MDTDILTLFAEGHPAVTERVRQHSAQEVAITVLTVETDNGPREIPLAGKHLEFGSRRAAQRRIQANTFCGRILVALNA